ncbi:hydroxyneurosporene synthase, partial [Acidiphilium sp. JA12-A1]|uniref:hydroxyneurosporene synthase n=2 Tax=unclassified Acidiphilium TaxID=2617493 RepID=UPI000689E4FB
TERRRHCLRAEADSLAIGPSRLAVDARGLAAEIAEWSNPLPRRVRGTIRLVPHALEPTTYKLDAAGRHRWQPLAPCARIRVAFTAPELAWEGNAYLDRNDGDEPIAHAFRRWHWSRAATRQGAAILYHAERRDGGQTSLALGFAAGGGATAFTPPPAAALPATRWRLARETRSDGGASLIRNLEDTPFYARARIGASLGGEAVEAVHETLDCDRLVHPAVQFMLPFRMPRRFI